MMEEYSVKDVDAITLRDYLAKDRTSLANQRTLLAYIRTALALFSAGVAIFQFIDCGVVLKIISCLFVLFAPLILVFGIISYKKTKNRLDTIRH